VEVLVDRIHLRRLHPEPSESEYVCDVYSLLDIRARRDSPS
jgi:hypothetical protein